MGKGEAVTALAVGREREGCRREGSRVRSCLGWKEGGWRLEKELLLLRAGYGTVWVMRASTEN